MAGRLVTINQFEKYEQLMIPARERFAHSAGLRALQSRTDEVFLETFLLQFCSLGVQMTRPVERCIRRAAERCAEIGLFELARALASHAKAEAGHHLMMIADVASLADRWNALRQPPVSADHLLRQAPSPGVLAYRRVHEDCISSTTPYAQIAIQYEIEMLPLRFGQILTSRCIAVLGPEIESCLSFVTEHVKLDIAHTKMNASLIAKMLRRDSQSISALVSAGTAALDAYAGFLSDCVRLADKESGKTRSRLSIRTPSTAFSWRIQPPLAQVASDSNLTDNEWMKEVRSFRGSVLFDNGRRPRFQTETGTFLDEDSIDTHAYHILTYCGDRLVGCVRVYFPTVDTPPCVTEKVLGEHEFALMLEKLGLKRVSVVEIGRWMVDPDHRSPSWLAAQLAAGSAALAHALKYASVTPRDLVLCSVGTNNRQDATLARIGLVKLRIVDRIYCRDYDDMVDVFFCSKIDGLSLGFQRLIMKMSIKLDIRHQNFCESSPRLRMSAG